VIERYTNPQLLLLGYYIKEPLEIISSVFMCQMPFHVTNLQWPCVPKDSAGRENRLIVVVVSVVEVVSILCVMYYLCKIADRILMI